MPNPCPKVNYTFSCYKLKIPYSLTEYRQIPHTGRITRYPAYTVPLFAFPPFK